MSLTAPQLVQRLPPSWWGLFGAMRADHRHGDAVEVWYQSEAKSGYGGLPDWDELLASLLDEEPVCEGSSLCFKPKFVQLPCDIQCQFLKFVSKHCEEVPLCALSEFVYTVQSCDANPESWPGILLKTLCTYIKISNKSYVGYETLRDADTPYPFTSGNAGAVTSLCDKVRQSSRQCSTWKRMHLTESPTLRKNIEMEVRPKTSSDWCPASDPPPSPGDVATPEVDDVPTKHSEDIITILSDNEEEMEVLESKEEDTNVDILFTEAEMKESCVEEETVDPILLGKGEKLRESWQSGLDTSEIDLFLTASPHQINAVARVVGWSSLSDGEVLAACHSLSTLSSVLSDATSVQFMSSMVLPKVVGLQQSASRQLLGVISLAAEHFPRGLIDGVFKTCLEQGIGSAQTDVFCKAIKTALSDSSKVQMLRRLMECTRNLDDNIICLFQTLLDTKVAMADDTLTELVNTLHSNASRMEKNLKYGKLLLAVINKHGPQLTRSHIEVLGSEVQKNGTFLKKSLDAALKKLQK